MMKMVIAFMGIALASFLSFWILKAFWFFMDDWGHFSPFWLEIMMSLVLGFLGICVIAFFMTRNAD